MSMDWPTDRTLDIQGVAPPLGRLARRERLAQALVNGDPIIQAAVEIRDVYLEVDPGKIPVILVGLIEMVNKAGL